MTVSQDKKGRGIDGGHSGGSQVRILEAGQKETGSCAKAHTRQSEEYKRKIGKNT